VTQKQEAIMPEKEQAFEAAEAVACRFAVKKL